MERLTPGSLVALVLAGGVAFAIGALAIGAAVAEGSAHLNFSEPAATTLSTALGAAVGAVAGYLGFHKANGDGVAPPPDEQPTEVIRR